MKVTPKSRQKLGMSIHSDRTKVTTSTLSFRPNKFNIYMPRRLTTPFSHCVVRRPTSRKRKQCGLQCATGVKLWVLMNDCVIHAPVLQARRIGTWLFSAKDKSKHLRKAKCALRKSSENDSQDPSMTVKFRPLSIFYSCGFVVSTHVSYYH